MLLSLFNTAPARHIEGSSEQPAITISSSSMPSSTIEPSVKPKEARVEKFLLYSETVLPRLANITEYPPYGQPRLLEATSAAMATIGAPRQSRIHGGGGKVQE